MGRLKMRWRNLLVSGMILATSAAAPAQSPTYGLGSTPSAEQIRAWDITISDEGKDLPAGSGTPDEGAKIYMQKCAACHGPNGSGGLAPAVVKSNTPTATGRPRRVMVTRVPFAPVLWGYINSAMPMRMGPGTLKPDEVYSLTAFLLYKNDVINENDVLDAETLPKVKMPNRDGFIPPPTEPWKR
jgi:mono/diheme cytochrome c family protein